MVGSRELKISNDIWCLGPESNRHGSDLPRDFKSLASTISATQAIAELS
jgi:hypothetical protein